MRCRCELRRRPNLGKYAACRRVARTIYLGSAPTATAANRGIEDRRIKLGCVMPGESPAIFGDALRRLERCDVSVSGWSALLVLNAANGHETRRRSRGATHSRSRQSGSRNSRRAFALTCARPATSSGSIRSRSPGDVPDETDARLVVLGIAHPYSKEPSCAAITAAKSILEIARQHSSSISQYAGFPRS